MKKDFAYVLSVVLVILPACASPQPVNTAQLENLVRNAKPVWRYPCRSQSYGDSGASVSTYMDSGSSETSCKLTGLQLAKAIMQGTQYRINSVNVRFYDLGNREHWVDVFISQSTVKTFSTSGYDQNSLLAGVKSIDNFRLLDKPAPSTSSSVNSTSSSTDGNKSSIPWAAEQKGWQDASREEAKARRALDEARRRLRNYTPVATAYNDYDPSPDKDLQKKIESSLANWQQAHDRLDQAFNALQKAKNRSQGTSSTVSSTTSSAAGTQTAASRAEKQKAWEEACHREESARRDVDEAKKALSRFSPVLSSDDSFNSNQEKQLQKSVESATSDWQQARDEVDRAYEALHKAKE